ncbi:MAG: DUF3006 domain-containing protein [bacterium]|nr:DUF3006 domain-containing protein [bacterium]
MKIIQATIDRIEKNTSGNEEDNLAVLIYKNKTITIPLIILPENVKEGDVIKIICQISDDETDMKKELAKHTLNEILSDG